MTHRATAGTPATTEEVYLDCNAGAPLHPRARAAMLAAMEVTGNPASPHAAGARARRLLEDARDTLAQLAGCTPGDVVFLSGPTEANALALAGLPGRRVLCGAMEHPSLIAAARRRDPDTRTIPALPSGLADVAALGRMLAEEDEGTVIVATSLVNAETGVIQPVADMAALVHARGGRLHCDAAQATGRMPVSLAATGADTLALSSAKCGGPPGCGALLLAGDVLPDSHPGGQESGRRAGTQNLPGVAGFVAALAAADPAHIRATGQWRDRFEAHIRASAADAVIWGLTAPRLPCVSLVSLPGHSAMLQLAALDMEGIRVGTGPACASGRGGKSQVLAAMGAPDHLATTAIRISAGWASRESDFLALHRAWDGLRRHTAGSRTFRDSRLRTPATDMTGEKLTGTGHRRNRK